MKKKKSFPEAYKTDASRITGTGKEVAHPKTITELQTLVREHESIIPRGGGTGFVGGVVPQTTTDIVLDLSHLNKIGILDTNQQLLTIECGVILSDLQYYLHTKGYEFPIDTLSENTCTIGGMIATNAIGGRGMKYGRITNWIRWIEIINSEGNIQRKGLTEISDYAGMEGTTGIITRACIKVIPKITRTASLVAIGNLTEIEPAITKLKQSKDISMVELLSKQISELLGIGERYHLLIEYENDKGTAKKQEYEHLMSIRKQIYGAIAREGHTRIEDIKIPTHTTTKLLTWLEEKKIPFYAHTTQGIYHPCLNKEQEQHIQELLKHTVRIGGTIQASHGIGIQKKEYVEHLDKKIYENIQKRLDPKNKFNKGKMI